MKAVGQCSLASPIPAVPSPRCQRFAAVRALPVVGVVAPCTHPALSPLSQGKSKKAQACTGFPKKGNGFVELSEI